MSISFDRKERCFLPVSVLVNFDARPFATKTSRQTTKTQRLKYLICESFISPVISQADRTRLKMSAATEAIFKSFLLLINISGAFSA